MSLKLTKDPGTLIREFYEDYMLRGMTKESARRYRSSLLIFRGFINNKGLSLDSVNTHLLKNFNTSGTRGCEA